MQLDAFWVNVGVLIACLPSAGNIYVLALRYDGDPERASAAILLSTIVSVVSFPCEAWLAMDVSAPRRFSAELVGVFAAVAMLLSSIGIYGL